MKIIKDKNNESIENQILNYFEQDFSTCLTQWAKKGNNDYLFHWVIWHEFLPREIPIAEKLKILKSNRLHQLIKKILKKYNAHLVRRNTTLGIWFDDGTDDHPPYINIMKNGK